MCEGGIVRNFVALPRLVRKPCGNAVIVRPIIHSRTLIPSVLGRMTVRATDIALWLPEIGGASSAPWHEWISENEIDRSPEYLGRVWQESSRLMTVIDNGH